ncbi:carboxylesterase/lipase family protein [Mycobacterium sp. NPDC051804]|uniref:carboxylesterase/lipase family protein n=1 Tax=Mycobacterium sp. NPDC051804 TaxID=3364295 RepID=UPI0037A6A1A5
MPVSKVRRRGYVISVIATVLIAIAALAGCSRGQSAAIVVPDDPGVVQTVSGSVRGLVSVDHRLFAGIPYAAPPVGELRWQPPAPAAEWTGFRDATQAGPRCVQDVSNDIDQRATSEDCLTLNVWTPPPSGEKRPVMVWIHGGSFINGSGDIYDSRWLASRGDVVVVTINYRLGTLGFLAHPALGPAGDVGNYGLADQQAALRWVRDNIAEFGGDPDKVTIAGESAGGMSVCDHLVAPASAGLFSAAIIQSGPCQAQYDLPAAERASEEYAAEVGCAEKTTAAACLRALPPERLQRPVLYGRIGSERLSGPVTGTKALPVDPMTGAAQGRAAKVPVMIGTTADEFTLFAALQYIRGRAFGATDYLGLLSEAYGSAHAGVVAQQYPPEQFGGSVPLAYSAAVTDGTFACVADRLADSLSAEESVYFSEFADRGAPAPEPLAAAPFPVGAGHSLELRYLFDVGGAPPLNPEQQRLSDEMIDDWVEFISTGSPGSGWPSLDGPEGERMSLQPGGNRVISGFDQAHRCTFWAALKI